MAEAPPIVDAPKSTSFLDALNQDLKDSSGPGETGSASAVQPPPNPAPAPPKPTQPDPKPAPANPEDAADEEILAGKRSPKSEDFKRVKTTAATFRTEAETARAELLKAKKELETALKAPKPDVAEIETLKAELAKHKTISETIGLEFNAEFQQKYQTKFDTILNGLKAGLPADKADKIVSALGQPDGEYKRKLLAELTEGMDDFTRTEIAAVNRELRGINAERQAELTNAGTKLAELHKQKQEAGQKRQTELAQSFETALKRAQDPDPTKGISVFQAREGDEAWNSKVKERAAIAKVIYEGDFAHDNERADAAMWAAAAPAFLEDLAAQSKEIAALKETIAKMQGSNPSIEGGGGASGRQKPASFLDAVNADLSSK
jgi:hypothetical protein